MNQISVAGVGFVVVWNWEQLYTLSVSEFVSFNLSYLELPLSWHYVDPPRRIVGARIPDILSEDLCFIREQLFYPRTFSYQFYCNIISKMADMVWLWDQIFRFVTNQNHIQQSDGVKPLPYIII